MKFILKSKIAFSILFCLNSIIGFAQVDQSLRIEYPIDDSYDHTVIAVSNQQKALVISKVKDKSRKVYNWSFDLIDENFKTIKKTQADFPLKFENYEYSFYDNHYYLLYYNNHDGKYNLLDLNVNDFTTKIQEGILAKGLRLNEIIAMDGNVFISALSKREQSIFVLNATTNKVLHVVPKELTDLKITYIDMQRVDNILDQKEMVYKYKVCEKEGCDYLMLRFDNNGNQIGNFFFLPKADADKELTSISLSKLSTDQYLSTGTYSVAKSKKANGIYIAHVNNSKVEFINYYNFLDLNNFTSYLSEKQQNKIEKKKDKKAASGEELNLSYNVSVHDITVQDGEYFFLGEFYYPTYRTETYTVMGANGSMSTVSRQVFDGYQYTHSCVAGFDMSGKLIWSNTFEMYLNYKPYTVRQYIRMNHEGENTKLVYATGTAIKTITFNKNKVIKDESVSTLISTDENDVVKRTTNNFIEWWYGQNYFSYGNQVIKNKENDSGNKKREVFYINKIAY
jgi:hypothetical protein